MVDYAIYLEASGASSSDSCTSNSLHERISALITDVTHSINHRSYVSLRHRPIAVSIETKTISRPEEEASVQLAIWIAAQLERIRSLTTETTYLTPTAAATKASRRKNPKTPSKELDHNAMLGRMVFPLLYVQSAQWTILFARPSPSPLADRRVVSSCLILSLMPIYRFEHPFTSIFHPPFTKAPSSSNTSQTIFSSIILGETSTLLGTYRLLRGLRVLE